MTVELPCMHNVLGNMEEFQWNAEIENIRVNILQGINPVKGCSHILKIVLLFSILSFLFLFFEGPLPLFMACLTYRVSTVLHDAGGGEN